MSKKISLAPLIILLVLILLVMIYPFMMTSLVWRTPRDIQIDPELINGLIALSGITLGFTTALITTRRKGAPSWIYLMLLANWAFLWYAAHNIFQWALGVTAPIDALTWTMSSLTLSLITMASLLVLLIFPRNKE